MIVTEDLDLVVSALSRWADAATNVAVFQAMEDALGILLAEVRTNVPVDTGALQDDANQRIIDFRPGQSVSGGVSMMKDGVQKPYAWMRELGGVITPRPENRKQLLFWVDKGNGELRVAKFVVQEGSFYMERSIDNVKAKVVETLGSAMTGAFNVFD